MLLCPPFSSLFPSSFSISSIPSLVTQFLARAIASNYYLTRWGTDMVESDM